MSTESNLIACPRCGTRYSPESSSEECPHAWQLPEPEVTLRMREAGRPYVREPWQLARTEEA